MAAAQPPLFQPARNLADMISFMTVAFVTGMIVHFLLPASASRASQLALMFSAGMPAGFVHAWWQSRLPKPPAAPFERVG
jgi:hypothetical protein